VLRHEIRLLATHLLRHRRIILDTGAHAHNESLIAHPAHHSLGILVALALHAAHHRLVADSPKGRAIRGALREVLGKLSWDVGHDVDRHAQLVDHGSLLSRKFADSIAMNAGVGGHSNSPAKNPAGRRFIDPGTLRLPMAHRGREHRQDKQ